MTSRTGKIAMLPAAVREELNQRILDGQQSPQLVPWLNSLPEVRQILAEHFEGKPVMQQNLSEWRLGGYEDWLFKRDHVATVKKLADHYIETAKAAGKTVAQQAADATAVEMTCALSDLVKARAAAEAREARAEARAQAKAERRAARLPAPVGDPACGIRSRPGDASPAPAVPPEQEEEEEEEEDDEQAGCLPRALVERFELLNKSSATAARLRRLEQTDTGFQLRNERQALTARIHAERQAQTLKLQTERRLLTEKMHDERLAFHIRVHEDEMSLRKPVRNGNGETGGGGLSEEGLLHIEKKLKIM